MLSFEVQQLLQGGGLNPGHTLLQNAAASVERSSAGKCHFLTVEPPPAVIPRPVAFSLQED